jgi:hypothetical protein
MCSANSVYRVCVILRGQQTALHVLLLRCITLLEDIGVCVKSMLCMLAAASSHIVTLH